MLGCMFGNSRGSLSGFAGALRRFAIKPHRASYLTASRSPLSARFLFTRPDVRNIAVIAHVDHGKTTLVDSMLSQSGTLANAHNRVMDSKDQERERGITILAKNTAIVLDGGSRRINIVDTPGHLDFSGEVERALQMVEGFVLLVDAKEGVRPGTRYVLRKALSLNLRPIVCVNKIDKDDSHIERTIEAIQDLFLETALNDAHLDIKFLYGSGREGYMNETPTKGGNLAPLFDAIFSIIPSPTSEDETRLQMLVAQIGEEEQTGLKTAIGRIFSGRVEVDEIVTNALPSQQTDLLVKGIQLFRGVELESVRTASFGDICRLQLQEPIAEKANMKIGSTIATRGAVHLVPYKKPDDPTYSLILQPSQASWRGKETSETMGRSALLRKRLEREAMVNTALQLQPYSAEGVKMMGRGPLHLSVIIEDMRREGYEFEIQSPHVMTRVIDDVECEPYERVTLEFNESLVADVVSFLSSKMAEVGETEYLSNARVLMQCVMPVRLMSTVPLRFHTMTGGDGVLNHSFDSYRPLAAVEGERESGALISVENGEVTEWSLSGLGSQGRFFILPGDTVFYGQIIGENTKTPLQNLGLNVCKRNDQLGGMRANANDKASSRRGPYSAQRFTFEDCVSWVTDDELITVTPRSIRMRKPNFNGRTTMRVLKRQS